MRKLMKALEADGEKLEQLNGDREISRAYQPPEELTEVSWADSPTTPWLPRLSSKEIMTLKEKIVEFIQDNDPFGDHITRHELRCLSQYFSDAATMTAGLFDTGEKKDAENE